MANKIIHLEPFQDAFYRSTYRFPGMLQGWGTGKTMMAIFKGMLLSQIYPNNRGVMIRRVFSNLAKSTMADFTEYTGLKIPQGTKKITVPGTKSEIMFMHADQLDQGDLQNVNLGWAYIEQAEEFDSDEAFTLLRGRMRKKLYADMDFQAANPAYDDLVAELKDTTKYPHGFRQVMVGANAAGHCWTWKKWIKDRREIITPTDGPIELRKPFKAFQLHEATSYDNYRNLPADFVMDIASMKQDNPAKYKRFVMNDHDEYDREGSYWSSEINLLRKKHPPQIGLVPHDPAYSVHTAWDVGYTTCMWIFQVVGVNRYFLRYYEGQGEGIQHYTDLLHKWESEKSYRYGSHFGPWDIDNPAHKATEGKTVRDIAQEHGIIFQSLPMDKDVNNSIETTKKHFPMSWFDAKGCETGLDALEWFHEKKNSKMSLEGRPYFTDKPEKDWSEHCSKAFIIADQGIPFIRTGSSITTEEIKKLQKQHGLVA